MKLSYKKLKPGADVKLFAVASKQGLLVDQHFGHADKFFIYSFSSEGQALVETREVKPYCAGDCEPDPETNDLMSKLSDCSYVLSLRIGYGPAQELKNAGISPVDAYGRIDAIIEAVAASVGENEIYRFAWPEPERS